MVDTELGVEDMAVLAVVYLDDVLESRSIVAALQQQLAVDGVNILVVTHDHTQEPGHMGGWQYLPNIFSQYLPNIFDIFNLQGCTRISPISCV